MSEKRQLLREYFGFDTFRPLQEEAVDALLQGRDLLMILPTGGGKSLCFQLPGLMLEGVTVVISPLIALMHDQVQALRANGIAAAMVSSQQNAEEIKTVYSDIYNGKLKFLYVAPERLGSESFVQMLAQIKRNFFVIDEAHCLSEWGHEFRGDYRRLDLLKQRFPDTPVAAFTATATRKVQRDILNLLGIEEAVQLRAKARRENLHLNVRLRTGNGRMQVKEFVRRFEKERGIIYAHTRKETEELATYLQDAGFNALAYHAGLERQERLKIQRAFIYDDVDIVVATVAFGMGIDKSNIRYVVHTSLPRTLEGYYQEIGRAGRDGADAHTLLLYKKGDEINRRSRILEDRQSTYQNTQLEKLKKAALFAACGECRHRRLAAYFDDAIDPCETLCDNCLRGEIEYEEVTTKAQMLLSAIYRSGQRFGQNHIIDILRGSQNKRLLELGHDRLSVYSIGKEVPKKVWEAVIDRLFEKELLELGEFAALKLTFKSAALLKGERSLHIDKERLQSTKEFQIQKSDNPAFEALKTLRKELADEQNVPAFVVFNDKSLLEMSEFLPQNKLQMLSITGVGEVKFKRYGKKFLQLCQELAKKDLSPDG